MMRAPSPRASPLGTLCASVHLALFKTKQVRNLIEMGREISITVEEKPCPEVLLLKNPRAEAGKNLFTED